ncbi:hypothetical protein DPEC_G00274650 [Dallia pectoralis]|uniref:Uncharacterized protein n=1 Tax=Dallia pectoralis TaxID=75939 RepID=A0ACC2FLE6_DALPE|nr:hypothetical protein DPEC_G00274650 [Dallia pectoralis]
MSYFSSWVDGGLVCCIHDNKGSTIELQIVFCSVLAGIWGLSSVMSDDKHTSVVTEGCSKIIQIHKAPAGQQVPGEPPALGLRGGRRMHQSTLTLGDPQACGRGYTTTHTESYSGRAADGQPLVFFLRDPAYPSQHVTQRHLSDRSTNQTQTHSREVHGPKDVIPFNVLHRLGQNNLSRNREGVAMRKVTNPNEPTLYWTTYCSEHRGSRPAPSSSNGRPTNWHQHNILTGEARSPAGPGKARRPSLERVLWATRRRETECCALRLY